MRASKATALLFVAMVVSGCRFVAVPEPSVSLRDAEYMSLVPNAIIDIQFERYEVDDPTGEAPGTIVVDTRERFLYLVLPNKRAIRYGVAVGEEALAGPARLPWRARPNGPPGRRQAKCWCAGRICALMPAA